jgi:hypothetical protein
MFASVLVVAVNLLLEDEVTHLFFSECDAR